MELKDFIKNSLVSIMEGLKDAQAELKENDSTGVINATRSTGVSDPAHATTNVNCRKIHTIKMDIAVTTDEQNKDGLNIKVYEPSTGKESASRIEFSVPVAYPY